MALKGLWDDHRRPTSDEEWHKVFDVLIEHLWKTKEDAAAWALAISRDVEKDWVEYEGRERELVADRALVGTFDRVTRYHARITNDLARLQTLYESLRSRRLPGGGSNEATPIRE